MRPRVSAARTATSAACNRAHVLHVTNGDAAAAKLGREVGRAVAAYFYEVDLEATKERD